MVDEIWPLAEEEVNREEKIPENKKNLRKKKAYVAENENLLDYDRILEEIYGENESDEEVNNLPLSITTKNWKKINKSKGKLNN